MNIEALIKAGNEYVRTKKAGGEPALNGPGHAAILLFGHAQNFAKSLRQICGGMKDGEREKLLIELWPLIVEAVREGESSQIDLAVKRICDTSENGSSTLLSH